MGDRIVAMLHQGESAVDFFAGWSSCGILRGGVVYLLRPIKHEEMGELVDREPDEVRLIAMPCYVSCEAPGENIRVYPVPDDDYELILTHG